MEKKTKNLPNDTIDEVNGTAPEAPSTTPEIAEIALTEPVLSVDAPSAPKDVVAPIAPEVTTEIKLEAPQLDAPQLDKVEDISTAAPTPPANNKPEAPSEPVAVEMEAPKAPVTNLDTKKVELETMQQAGETASAGLKSLQQAGVAIAPAADMEALKAGLEAMQQSGNSAKSQLETTQQESGSLSAPAAPVMAEAPALEMPVAPAEMPMAPAEMPVAPVEMPIAPVNLGDPEMKEPEAPSAVDAGIQAPKTNTNAVQAPVMRMPVMPYPAMPTMQGMPMNRMVPKAGYMPRVYYVPMYYGQGYAPYGYVMPNMQKRPAAQQPQNSGSANTEAKQGTQQH